MSDRPLSSEKDSLADRCREAAEFYKSKPGLAGVGTDIDLYHVCEILARRVKTLEADLADLREKFRGHGHG